MLSVQKISEQVLTRFRPGRILHAIGNLRKAQGRFEEAFDFHQRSRASFAGTVGKNHHRYADLCSILSEDYIGKGQHEEALYVLYSKLRNLKLIQHSELLDEALRAWEICPEIYRQETARALFLKAGVTQKTGKTMKANMLKKRAYGLFRQFAKDNKKKDQELTLEDFNNYVTFWSQ
jgi:hypothetical protein